MTHCIRFKHHLRPLRAAEDLVFLVGERDHFMLRGRTYGLLAPLLDGSRNVEQLARALEGVVPAVEVHYAVLTLRSQGYLAESEPDLPPEVAAFWQSLGIEPGVAQARLASSPVMVEATGSLDAQPLRTALASAGIRVENQAPVCVVLTDDYLSDDLASFNRLAVAGAAPRWMPVKPTGVQPWIGPMFRPGSGACWACVAQRVRANRPVEAFVQRNQGLDGGSTRYPTALLGAGVHAAAHLAAASIARWIVSGEEGVLNSSLLALDLASFRLTEHPVTRRPQCPVCGDSELLARRGEKSLPLQSRPKRFTEDGGHRIASPEETYRASYTRQVSPITGIISGIEPSAKADLAARPVYGAVFSTCPSASAPGLVDFYQSSSGKGRTAAQARASALGEAIERWSSLFQGDEPRISARIRDLGDAAIHPSRLLNYSEAQYRAREAINAKADGARFKVPEPFDERAEIEWTPVWSLTSGRRRYVPTAYCYNSYPTAPASRVFPKDSNGNAAGNCLEEAILQGFFELVERDAVALWWYSQSRRPGVDLKGFGDPYFADLEAHYRSLGYKIWVLDVTTDLGIPAFVAFGAGPEQRLIVGFGCHFDARIGVQRALTELNQLYITDMSRPGPWKSIAPETLPYLFPDPSVPRLSASAYVQRTSDDILTDVLACVERAAGAGLETLALDLTRPDVGFTAVKVIVPGLRHFWPRFGPGRLYEVPELLGWTPRARREEDLNPLPIFW